jgi:type VI secretion system secreted protein Hcp
MATDMTLKLKGIEGESVRKGHENEIDVLSFSYGATQSGTAHDGTGSTAGKANVQDLSITKKVDKSTPLLFGACLSGKHVDEAVLTCQKAGGDSKVAYLKVTLTQVLVTSISTGASASDDQVMETVSLNYATIKEEYTPQTGKGAGGGAVVQGWNVATGEPA